MLRSAIWATGLLAVQVFCFDLRPVPSDITKDAKTVKSQEEPCICHTTTNISVSITVTISLTVCFYHFNRVFSELFDIQVRLMELENMQGLDYQNGEAGLDALGYKPKKHGRSFVKA